MTRLPLLLVPVLALFVRGYPDRADERVPTPPAGVQPELTASPQPVAAGSPQAGVDAERDATPDEREVRKQLEALRVAIERDDHQAFNAAYAILCAARDQHDLADVLLSHIDSTKGSMQRDLMRAVRWLPPESRIRVVPSLTRIAAGTESENREWAIDFLGEIGPRAGVAVPALTDCLRDDAVTIRCRACVALWHIEHRVGTIFPVLNDALTPKVGPNVWLNWQPPPLAVIKAVAEIGPALKTTEVGTRVLALMYDPDPWVRVEVYPLVPEFAASKEIAAEMLTAAYLAEADRVDLFSKKVAAGEIPLGQAAAARRIGPHEGGAVERSLLSLGGVAVPELVKLLPLREHYSARSWALWTLKKMGKAAAPAADEVWKLLDDPDASLRNAARETLKVITGD